MGKAAEDRARQLFEEHQCEWDAAMDTAVAGGDELGMRRLEATSGPDYSQESPDVQEATKRLYSAYKAERQRWLEDFKDEG